MKRLLIIPITAAVVLCGAGAAHARGPVLTAVTVLNPTPCQTRENPPKPATCGHPRAVWALPTNVRAQFIEIATSDAVGTFGYFAQRNIVSYETLRSDQTSYTDDLALLPGTYYLHVGGRDVACDTCPGVEFSRIMRFTVTAAGTGTGTDAGPTPIKGDSDKRKPTQRLAFKRRQDVDRLSLRARMNERGTLAASATVNVPGASAAKRFSFTSVTRRVTANKRVTLRLRLTRSARSAVKRALRRGDRLRARIRVTAVDRSGNSSRKTVSVRLTP